jgi:LysM repeat protein
MTVKDAGRVPVREIIEFGSPVKNVLSLDVAMSPAENGIEEGENVLDSTANVLVIYTGDDGGIYSSTRQIGVVFTPSEDDSDISVRTGVEDLSYSVDPSGGLDVRFTALFSPVVTALRDTEVITNLEADPTVAVMGSGNAPSVVLRYPRKNESIWEIAKQYRTTIGAIQSANSLEPAEFAPEGKLLLIPRK